MNSRLRPPARRPRRPGTRGAGGPKSLRRTLALAPFSGRCFIAVTHRALARGAAVDEVLPPSGLVADMVVGVCLESVHYHECQHACFNQEPSSIPNTALLNGKTFQHFNYKCVLFSGAYLTLNIMFAWHLFVAIFLGSVWQFITLMLLSDRLTI